MRISKPRSRWFKVPEDPDNSRIKIKQLSPGERQDLFDKVFSQEIEYDIGESGKMMPKMKQATNNKLDRETTLTKVILDWENFFDRDGSPLECNEKNIIRASREIDGFTEFVTECRQKLDDDVNKEEKELEKN